MSLSRRLVLAVIVAGVTSTTVAAQPNPDPHATYDALLRNYVGVHADGINRIDFARWKASAQDRQDIARYITAQSERRPSTMAHADAFAYWVNLYNAIHMNVILDHYPVPSFAEIPSSGNPWKDKRITIEGRNLSLDEIKSDVMRPVLADPRLHYAINCASYGCPRLMPRAWRAETLEADLQAAARAFINHPRAVKVLPSGDIQVSSIFVWYAADFGRDEAEVIAHMRRFAEPDLAARLATPGKLVDGGYDWSLVAKVP